MIWLIKKHSCPLKVIKMFLFSHEICFLIQEKYCYTSTGSNRINKSSRNWESGKFRIHGLQGKRVWVSRSRSRLERCPRSRAIKKKQKKRSRGKKWYKNKMKRSERRRGGAKLLDSDLSNYRNSLDIPFYVPGAINRKGKSGRTFEMGCFLSFHRYGLFARLGLAGLITRTSGKLGAGRALKQTHTQPRFEYVQIRSPWLTTDIAWSMAVTTAHMGQNWTPPPFTNSEYFWLFASSLLLNFEDTSVFVFGKWSPSVGFMSAGHGTGI